MASSAASEFGPVTTEKRKQKFLGFAFEPGDAELLPSLPEGQRQLLQTEGQYKDRAQKLGLPIGTVRSRLHRARAALLRLREEHPARN